MNILGIGEAVVDVIYNKGDIIKYDGGGTAFNVIYNLKDSKHKLFIGGSTGKDKLSEKIFNQFEELEINAELLGKQKKNTRVVTTVIKDGDSDNLTKCIKCSKDTWGSASKLKVSLKDVLNLDIDLVVFDKYITGNNLLSRELKDNNITTVLDWGIIGNLRYLSKDKIYEIKNIPYDIVQINGRVAKFLKTRLEIETDLELFKFLGVKLLVVTYSKEGATVILNASVSNGSSKSKSNDNNIIEKRISFKVKDVIDNNGAGDAFLSAVIEEYLKCLKSGNLDDSFHSNLESSAKDRVTKVLSTMGARYNSKGFNFKSDAGCIVCGREEKKPSNRKRKYKLQTAVEQIEKRLKLSLKSSVRKDIDGFLKNIGKNLLIAGQGASYTSGVYISELLNSSGISNSKVHLNNDIYNMNLKFFDDVLILSSSGSSPDVVKLINYLKEKKKKVHILTAKDKAYFNNDPDINIISYNSDGWSRERGFISIESIIVPAMHFLAAVNNESSASLAESSVKYISDYNANKDGSFKFSKGSNIDIFYDISNLSASIDLESKLIESGLSRVTLHEKKNFSHGRFSIIKNIKPDFVIYIDYDSDNRYERKLYKYLEDKGLRIYNLSNISIKDNKYRAYFNLLLNQLLINDLAKYLDEDISNQSYDKEDEKLYKFK